MQSGQICWQSGPTILPAAYPVQNMDSCVFKIFGHRHWREMRKNQYYYYDTFLTIDIDLCVKYKRDMRFHYEI